jgi:hypothetical protein
MLERLAEKRLLTSDEAKIVLGEMAAVYRELAGQILAGTSAALRDRVTGEESETAPLSIPVLVAMMRIDAFAEFHARALMDESIDNWAPSSSYTPDILDGLAGRIGHFTANPDPRIVEGFDADLREAFIHAVKIARPSGIQTRPIDVACFEVGCDGEYRVTLPRPEEVDGLTDIERERRFKDSRPAGVCTKNHSHRIDAMLAIATDNRQGIEAP